MASNRRNLNSSKTLRHVLSNCQQSIENGEFYEAHQMYRTLYFRYSKQGKQKEASDILHEGAVTLLKHEQNESAVDLTMLLIDYYTKEKMAVAEENIDRVIDIFERLKPDKVDRQAIVVACVNWSCKIDAKGSRLGHPDIHQRFAVIFWQEQNFVQSRYHFVHCNDGQDCGFMLIKHHMTLGYKSEVDLFITQTVLQYLCLCNQPTASTAFFTYTQHHPYVNGGPPYLLPLLNFVWLLLLAVERVIVSENKEKKKSLLGSHQKSTPRTQTSQQSSHNTELMLFAVLCEKYEPSINRDPIYKEYLDRIGQVFFGLPEPQKTGGFLENLLQDFMGDSSNEASSRAATASTSLKVMDLD